MAMWQPSILATYKNGTTSYIDQLSGPMRLKYPNKMAEKELITSLTEVSLKWFIQGEADFSLSQGDKVYNAYEKDIAIVNIFFGESTVFGEPIESKQSANQIKKISQSEQCSFTL